MTHTLKTISITICSLCMSFLCAAQTREDIVSDTDHYLYGEGYGFTLQEAKDMALKDLLGKIRISVSNETSSDKNKSMSDGQVQSSSNFANSLTTYSQASLVGLRSMIIKNEPDAEFFYYIPIESVDKMFEIRRQKVEAFISAADSELEKLKIDAALRDYYWADALLNSLRNPEDVVVYENDQPILASIYLPRKIESILDGLKAVYVRESPSHQNCHELFFTYDGTPVSSLEISYMDGAQWYPCSVTDGLALVEFSPLYEVDDILIRYEYCFENTLGNDDDVKAVLKVLKFRPNKSAYATVPVKDKQADASPAKNKKEQKSIAASMSTPIASAEAIRTLTEGAKDEASLTKVMDKLVDAINHQSYEGLDDCFADDGHDIFKRLISYGNATIVGIPSYTYVTLGDEIYCRSVPMSFSFPGQRKFVEDVVFTFNPENKVTNICFGLGKEATRAIYEHEGEWTREARIIIVNFLENYKTAYALERLDYLNSIFADDALIISGKVVYRTEAGDDYKNNKYVEKTRKDKTTYMHDLKQIFAANNFINIKFSNNDIVKMRFGGEVYGIQIKQDYYSSKYSDTGYLYLHVDVNDPKRPIIHVRAWQEDFDPDWGLVGPDMF